MVDEQRCALAAAGGSQTVRCTDENLLLCRVETPTKTMNDVPRMHPSDDVGHSGSGIKAKQTRDERLQNIEVNRTPLLLGKTVRITEDMKDQKTRAIGLCSRVSVAQAEGMEDAASSVEGEQTGGRAC